MALVVQGFKMKANYVAWLVTISGAMFVTMGHYIPEWPILYILCMIVGFVTSLVLEGIE